MVDIGKEIRLTGEEWTSTDNGFVDLTSPGDDLPSGRLLHNHGTDHDRVGPFQVAVPQPVGVHVDQAQLPGFRKEGGDRECPQGRERSFFAQKP